MAGFREYLIAFLLVGIFTIALISFGVELANDNNANANITDNKLIKDTYVSINDTLQDAEDTAENVKDAAESDLPVVGQTLILTSIWPSILNLGSLIISLGNLLLSFPAYLGIPVGVTGIFLAIIVVTFILLGWKMIRSGS